MKRPKLLIIVLFQNLRDEQPYYAPTPAPPLPGALLAGMTPPIVDVELLHEMARPIDYDTDADFVALSFMDYLAPHAYEVAARFRLRGKVVVGGGKFVSTFPDEAQPLLRLDPGRRGAGRLAAHGRGHGGGPAAAPLHGTRGRAARHHPRAALRPRREGLLGADRHRDLARLPLRLHLLPAQHPPPALPHAAGGGRDPRPDEHRRAAVPPAQAGDDPRQQPRRRHGPRQGAAARDREARLLGHRRAVQHRLPRGRGVRRAAGQGPLLHGLRGPRVAVRGQPARASASATTGSRSTSGSSAGCTAAASSPSSA